MEILLKVKMLPQPDDVSCGPTCLHALYRYFNDRIPLAQVVSEVKTLSGGGTLDVFLANHALARGYQARIFTYNLHLFDPTWFPCANAELARRLRLQLEHHTSRKFRVATRAYLQYLARGGRVFYEELNDALIRHFLERKVPILTGLSATYLYGSAREFGKQGEPDDLRGRPAGHFVLLCGYNSKSQEVLVADPLRSINATGKNQYAVGINRVIAAILLGIVTYDANLLVIEPGRAPRRNPRAGTDRRR